MYPFRILKFRGGSVAVNAGPATDFLSHDGGDAAQTAVDRLHDRRIL